MNKPHIRRIDGIWKVRTMRHIDCNSKLVNYRYQKAYIFILKLNGWLK